MQNNIPNLITLILMDHKIRPWIKCGFIIGIPFLIIVIGFLVLNTFFENYISNIKINNLLLISFGGILVFFLVIASIFNLRIIYEIGFIKISANNIEICVQNKTIKLDSKDIARMKIRLMGFKGQQQMGANAPDPNGGGDTESDGLYQMQGYENKIRIKTKLGKRHNFNFYLQSKIASDSLKRIIKELKSIYPLKINIVR